MFDGRNHGVPGAVIKVTKVSGEPEDFNVNSGTQTRYRVDLVVEFRSPLILQGFEGEFKNGTRSSDDRMTHETWVYVLNTKRFQKYMKWKVEDTTAKWEADNVKFGGDGSEDGSEDEEGEGEGDEE